MPVRVFNGSTDAITFLPGATVGYDGGPGTIALLVKRNNTNNGGWITAANNATTGSSSFAQSAAVWVQASGSDFMQNSLGGASDSVSTVTVTNASGWVLLVITKASGSATPRMHRYNLTGATITRGNGSVAQADSTSPLTSTYRWEFGKDEFTGHVAYKMGAAAVWNQALSDAQVDELYAHLNTNDWLLNSAGPPLALWEFNQPTATTPIRDAAGGGAVQDQISGTTVDTTDLPPGWTFLPLADIYSEFTPQSDMGPGDFGPNPFIAEDYPPVTITKHQSLTDDFSSGALQNPPWTNNSGTVGVTSNKATLSGLSARIQSAANYTLQDSYLLGQLDVTGMSGTIAARMLAYVDVAANNYFQIFLNGTTWFASERQAGAVVGVEDSGAWTPSTEQWWRIRHVTGVGVTFEKSSDGISWTVLKTVASPTINVANPTGAINFSTSSANTATGNYIVDNVNLAPTGGGNVSFNMGTTQAIFTLTGLVAKPNAKVSPPVASMLLQGIVATRGIKAPGLATMNLAGITYSKLQAQVKPPVATVTLSAQVPTWKAKANFTLQAIINFVGIVGTVPSTPVSFNMGTTNAVLNLRGIVPSLQDRVTPTVAVITFSGIVPKEAERAFPPTASMSFVGLVAKPTVQKLFPPASLSLTGLTQAKNIVRVNANTAVLRFLSQPPFDPTALKAVQTKIRALGISNQSGSGETISR
jgi:hypothetical protein